MLAAAGTPQDENLFSGKPTPRLAGPVQPIHYPVPWAHGPSISFLPSAEDIRALLAGIGFTELAWEDCTPASIARLHSGGEIVRENMRRNHVENRLLIVQAVFQRA